MPLNCNEKYVSWSSMSYPPICKWASDYCSLSLGVSDLKSSKRTKLSLKKKRRICCFLMTFFSIYGSALPLFRYKSRSYQHPRVSWHTGASLTFRTRSGLSDVFRLAYILLSLHNKFWWDPTLDNRLIPLRSMEDGKISRACKKIPIIEISSIYLLCRAQLLHR